MIESIEAQYAPDKRVAVFDVSLSNKTLVGETNSARAKARLLDTLSRAGYKFVDSITLLPPASLNNQHFAVVNVSVANIRTEGKHQAELATQAVLGTRLQVLKKQRSWYLVQTPDRYIGWIDGGAIQLFDSAGVQTWSAAEQYIFTQPFGFAYEQPDKNAGTVSDLVFGSLLNHLSTDGGFIKFVYPDGRRAYVAQSDVQPYTEWLLNRRATGENLVSSAKQLLGLPYLWGGTSFKGVDCSGFTKTVFFMNGLMLSRDASQQAMQGSLVNTTHGWSELKPGDLLFFGAPASEEKKARIVHVGMWLGNSRFIHASNRVRINSVDPAAADFDGFEVSRFLFARRIDASSPEHKLVQSGF